MNFRLTNQIGFAFAHFSIGVICLSLAIPPGYSSPIWPAAAVAAVAFFRIGRHAVIPIFASAFLMNLVSKGLENIDVTSLASYSVIAGGTVVQGFVGGFIIRRLEFFDSQLSNPLLVLKYSSYLVFFSTLINATISIPFLYFNGLVPSTGVLANWLTWWVGDALGMAIFFVPLYLLFRSKEHEKSSRDIAASLFAAFVLLLSIPSYLFMVQHHENLHLSKVREDAGRLLSQIETIRNQNDAIVNSLGALKNTINDLSSSEFAAFANPLLAEFPATQALEWAPRIEFDERPGLGTRENISANSDFTFIPSEGGKLFEKTDAIRPDRYPVTYVYPLTGNEKAVGFDLASEGIRAEAIYESIKFNRLATTRPIVLVQESEGESFSYLSLLTIFGDGNSGVRMSKGVVLGVFRFNDIVEAAMENLDTDSFKFVLFDPREPNTIVYSNYEIPPISSPDHNAANPVPPNIEASFIMSLGHKSPWAARVYPSSSIYEFSNWWEIWAILVIGSFLIFVSTVSFAVFSAQPEVIKNLVSLKTKELESAKNTLHNLNIELDSRVSKRTAELEKVNNDLNFFVSAVSHDLHAPLAKLRMFVGLLQTDLKQEHISENSASSLKAINNGAKAMNDLIRSLLSLANAKNQPLIIAHVSLDELVHNLLIIMDKDIEKNNTTIECDPLPIIQSDKTLLTQLFQNLISNAIKFSSKNAVPKVKIAYSKSKYTGDLVFTVEDNGIGVAEKERSDVFSAFHRIHSRAEYPGSGIGLALCDKIVTRLNGTIWVENSALGGAKFCFIIQNNTDPIA